MQQPKTLYKIFFLKYYIHILQKNNIDHGIQIEPIFLLVIIH